MRSISGGMWCSLLWGEPGKSGERSWPVRDRHELTVKVLSDCLRRCVQNDQNCWKDFSLFSILLLSGDDNEQDSNKPIRLTQKNTLTSLPGIRHVLDVAERQRSGEGDHTLSVTSHEPSSASLYRLNAIKTHLRTCIRCLGLVPCSCTVERGMLISSSTILFAAETDARSTLMNLSIGIILQKRSICSPCHQKIHLVVTHWQSTFKKYYHSGELQETWKSNRSHRYAQAMGYPS